VYWAHRLMAHRLDFPIYIYTAIYVRRVAEIVYGRSVDAADCRQLFSVKNQALCSFLNLG